MLLLYGAYQSYWLQRQSYKDNISLRLEMACAALIQNDFGHHASTFSTIKRKDNVLLGTEYYFNLTNDLLWIKVEGSSFLYFQDYAPQEIRCRADLRPDQNKITSKTKIHFQIFGPDYLPQNIISRLKKQTSFVLSMRQIDASVSLISLEKPKYSIF